MIFQFEAFVFFFNIKFSVVRIQDCVGMDSGEGMEGLGRNWGDWLKLEVGLGRRTRRAIRPSVGFNMS
jgi:hypothetical protein